jgi:hypothetical protein
MDANRQRSGHETGYRRARDECFRCFHLVFCFLFLSFSFPAKIRRESLKMGWMLDGWRRFETDYASLQRMELEFFWGCRFPFAAHVVQLAEFRRNRFGFLTKKTLHML